jgi:excisionase family DNA binding protein
MTLDDTLRAILRDELRTIVREEMRAALAEAKPAPAPVGAYLTVDQVAEQCGVKPATVRAWISKGELKAGRAGHRIAVPPQALEDFVATAGHRRATHTTLDLEAALGRLAKRSR